MSIFQHYPAASPRIALSLGIERAILSRLDGAEELTEAAFAEIVTQAYRLVHPPKVVAETLAWLCRRVSERIGELQQKAADAPPPSCLKTLGSSYANWLGGLDASGACLYLAGYDIDKALRLYWQEDLLLVQEAVKIKGQQDSQLLLAQMESCLYGFGGKYAGDEGGSGGQVIEHDMNTPAGRDALKAFGF